MKLEKIKFCNNCGSPVNFFVPNGDNFNRYICTNCNKIHYQNPAIIAGCIAELNNKILLCKRNIEPKRGYWTFPAGFLESNETIEAAAIRETAEEANATVSNLDMFAMVCCSNINEVYVIYRATLETEDASPGPESMEVGLFDEESIPWSNLAYPLLHEMLNWYFDDKKRGKFSLHATSTEGKI
jgi:ADP-ribose pyrophosphatase YjhB (NUDIX family)